MQKSFVVQSSNLPECGVDWLTCTATGGFAVDGLEAIARRELLLQKEAGQTIRPASWQGYVGHRGENIFYGCRPKEAALTLSGASPLPLIKECIEAATNVSRIDLQITVRHEQPYMSYGKLAYSLLEDGGTRPGRKPIITRIHKTAPGETISVGSRLSDQYGRVYDHGVKHGTSAPGTAWRHEVEFKRDSALHIARQITLPDKALDSIARTVYLWYASRGLRLMEREPSGSLMESVGTVRNDPGGIEWLRRNVQSTVLKAVHTHGLAATLDALGLLNLDTIRKES